MLRYLMDYMRFNVLKNEEGQGMVEYGLIIALVAIAVMATLGLMGGGIEGAFQEIIDKLAE